MPRKRKLPPFESFEEKRWHRSGNSILATAQQVAEGLLKLTTREDINPTPIRVAAIILMRLEEMRLDAERRTRLALGALDQGDEARARSELGAVLENLQAAFDGNIHGVCVTKDLAYHGSRLAA